MDRSDFGDCFFLGINTLLRVVRRDFPYSWIYSGKWGRGGLACMLAYLHAGGGQFWVSIVLLLHPLMWSYAGGFEATVYYVANRYL